MIYSVDEFVSDARLAFIQGKYDESLKLAKQALAKDKKSADAHQCAGNAYMSKADYESAILITQTLTAIFRSISMTGAGSRALVIKQ